MECKVRRPFHVQGDFGWILLACNLCKIHLKRWCAGQGRKVALFFVHTLSCWFCATWCEINYFWHIEKIVPSLQSVRNGALKRHCIPVAQKQGNGSLKGKSPWHKKWLERKWKNVCCSEQLPFPLFTLCFSIQSYYLIFGEPERLTCPCHCFKNLAK